MDPITIGAAVSAIGSLLGGISGFLGANSQAKALRAQAQQERAVAGVNAQVALDQGDHTVATAATQAAANGGGIDGSSIDVLNSMAQRSAFNARSAIYSGNVAAQNALYNAKVTSAQGTNGLISSVVSAAAATAGGFAASAQAKKILDIQKGLSNLSGGGMLGAMPGLGIPDSRF